MSSVFDALQRHLIDEQEAAKNGSAVSARSLGRVEEAITRFANLANTIDAVLIDYEGSLADRLRADLDACIGDAT